MEKEIDLTTLKLVNQERLFYHYLDRMLLSVEGGDEPEEYKKIEIDGNDRISDFPSIVKKFEDEFIQIHDGKTVFVSNLSMEEEMLRFQLEKYDKGINSEIIKELAEDAMIRIEEIVKHEKEIEGKTLKDTSATTLLSNLCDVYHKYNNEVYNELLLKLASLSETKEELEEFYREVHKNNVFNSPLTGNVKEISNVIGSNNELYNLFNKEIKQLFVDNFFKEKTQAHYISIRFLNNRGISEFLEDIKKEERFKDVKFEGGTGFINFNGLLHVAINKVVSGVDPNEAFYELKTLKEIGVFKDDDQRKIFDTDMMRVLQTFEEGGHLHYTLRDEDKTSKYKNIVLDQIKDLLKLQIPENDLVKKETKRPKP